MDNKYILIGIVMIFFLILIKENSYTKSNSIIKESNIKGGGRGVFSTTTYNKGDSIEVCPCIKVNHRDLKGIINKYVFTYDEKYSLIAFGFCSIYNHKDKPNAKWVVVNEEKLKIVAIKPIQKGEEIFISYGTDYFSYHRIQMK